MIAKFRMCEGATEATAARCAAWVSAADESLRRRSRSGLCVVRSSAVILLLKPVHLVKKAVTAVNMSADTLTVAC